MLSSVLNLIFQIVIDILTCFLSLIALKPKFRQKNAVNKEEGSIAAKGFVLLLIIAMLSHSYYSYTVYKSDNKRDSTLYSLQSGLSVIPSKIDLSTNKTGKKIELSEGHLALIASQNARKASDEAKATADSLKTTITGTNECPILQADLGKGILSILVKNNTNLSMFNVYVTEEMYEQMLGCETRRIHNGRDFIDGNCADTLEKSFNVPIIRSLETIIIPLPAKINLISGRLCFRIAVKNKKYELLFYYKKVGNNILSATRYYSLDIDKFNERCCKTIKETGMLIGKVNWNKLFTLPKNPVYTDVIKN